MIAFARTQRWGRHIVVVIAVACVFLLCSDAAAQSLRGSGASLDRQNRQAVHHDYSYLGNASEVQRFVEAGLLVPVYETADYWLKQVSFPVARPAVKLFIQRLGSQYRAACGERGGYQFDATSCQPAKQRITPLGSSNRNGSRFATSVSRTLSYLARGHPIVSGGTRHA